MADAAIMIFWLICLVRGLFRGPVNEFFSIAGILSGLVAAAWLYSPLTAVLPGGIGSAPLRRMFCFLFVFGGVCLLSSVAGIVAGYLMQLRRTGWLNRMSGAGLGILKGVLAVAVLLVPLVAFFPQKATRIGRSDIFAYENLIAEKVAWITPAALHHQFSSHADDCEQSWLKGRIDLRDGR